MERVDLLIKGTVGVIGAVISYLVDGLGLAFVILLGMMTIDYTTGIMAAIVNKNLSSSIGRNGFIRKMYVILLIGAIYMLASVVDGLKYIGDGVTIAYILIEFISITENGGKLRALFQIN
ncbi:phage holin family protein [Cytobacillus sp. Hz8]|uniref:phage holin family protein n=1 Tax=Cytobacillus sp. Hz8 TaxID=3347168 RepID=UPI0035E1ADF9